MSFPVPKLDPTNPDSAIFKYWLSHKDVGTPMTNEIEVEEGGVAVITSTGRILHWMGGNEVEVL